jgi:Na+/H+-dicarboxylate symporter
MYNKIIKVVYSFKRNIPVQVIIVLLLTIAFGKNIPEDIKRVLYSISFILKEVLLLILPLVVFCCAYVSVSTIKHKKSIGIFLLLLFVAIYISNYTATMVAYGVVLFAESNMNVQPVILTHDKELSPIWNISFNMISLDSNYALIVGFIVGICELYIPLQYGNYKLNVLAKKFVDYFLSSVFVRLLPFFILGFFIQMQHSGLLSKTIEKLLPLIVLISGTYIFYLSFLFAVIANFNLRLWISYIKNIIPAALTGFYTMSSLVTIPITIMSTEKNIKNPHVVRLVIPIATNIHMIGLAINIPMMALIILLSYGYELPTFTIYLIFAFNFALMQFAAAGAPGCGVLLMLPLLEKYLGFTNEMSALIVAIYILFDATETSANVIGNSALAVVLSKLAKVLRLSCYSSSKLEDNNVC